MSLEEGEVSATLLEGEEDAVISLEEGEVSATSQEGEEVAATSQEDGVLTTGPCRDVARVLPEHSLVLWWRHSGNSCTCIDAACGKIPYNHVLCFCRWSHNLSLCK